MTSVGSADPDQASPDARTAAARELISRWPAGRPFLVIGFVWITVGGMVAAVTRPTGFVLGSWTAAYLVLVGGVAQVALGAGQAWLAERPPNARRVRAEVGCWNIAVVATVAGTLGAVPLLTSLSGVPLVVALGSFLVTTKASGPAPRGVRACYRALVAIVLVSIPIGLVLAWIRHR